MSGGAGDDSLTAVDVSIPVIALGGAGNDELHGGTDRNAQALRPIPAD